MTDRRQTLVACERCGRGYPVREMTYVDGELVCAGCQRRQVEDLFRRVGKPYAKASDEQGGGEG